MKKKSELYFLNRESLKRLLRTMKVTIVILLVSVLSGWASVGSYAQSTKLSINMQKVSIKQIMQHIEDNSEFYFLYKNDVIDVSKVVNVKANDAPIQEILSQAFDGENVEYRIRDRQIIITERGSKSPNIQINGDRKISGMVKDSNGELIPGASVVAKGTSIGTITSTEGKFEINVPGKTTTLIVSFVGFKTQEFELTGQSNYQIVLEESFIGVDEVVVVGFGTQKKSSVSGSVTHVQMDELIADRPLVSSAHALQGVAPGLQVVSNSAQPGATSTELNVRGFTSINGSGEPLVLVDNVPMDLDDINPRDIESITVLKDAASASIYGARAAFGVIIISTKKAKKGESMKFQYSNTTSFNYLGEMVEKTTPKQFAEALKGWGVESYFSGQNVVKWLDYIEKYETNPSLLNDLYIYDPVRKINHNIVLDPTDNTHYPLTTTDNLNDFLNNTGSTSIHNFTVSGGNEKIAFRVNAGYSFEDGIFKTSNDQFKKYNLNANLNADLLSNLSSSTTIYYNKTNKKDPNIGMGSVIDNDSYNPTGYFQISETDAIPFDTPLNRITYDSPTLNETNNIRLFQKLEYSPLKDLSIIGEYTFEKGFSETESLNKQNRYASPFKFTENNADAQNRYDNTRLRRDYATHEYQGINVYARYSKQLNNHNLQFLSGINRETRRNNNFWAAKKTLVSTDLPFLGGALGEMEVDDAYSDWAIIGYFGQIDYNYADRYLLQVNARYDGSSRFLEGDRFVFLPSVSAGWNIHNESFMENANTISMLKLKGSWGEIGNQNTGDLYPMIPGFPFANADWVNLATALEYRSVNPAQLIAGSLTWEKVQTTNIAVDVALFKNKLSSTFEVYSRKTIGMLAAGQKRPAALGATEPKENAADLNTTGWDFDLGWKDKIGEIEYGINLSLWDNQTEITKFSNPGGLISEYYEGRKIGEIWGYVTDRFFTVDDFVEGTLDAHLSGDNRQLKEGIAIVENQKTPYPGDIKYVDLNGDGVINSGNNTLKPTIDPVTGEVIAKTGPGDRKVIGNVNRRYQFGVNGYVKYRNFDFSFILNGVMKRDLDFDNMLFWPYPSGFDNLFGHQLDYWMPDNQDAFYPRVHGDALNQNKFSNYGTSRMTQTKYLSSGAFLKIQNITLGYDVPKALLKKINIQKLRVFVSADNVLTFDKLPKGVDPEQLTKGGFTTGLENMNNEYTQFGNYPVMRNIAVGLNLTF